ncbi:MAG: iron-containing alcohol dehydrogenase [Anaerolineae bacterium]|nr:iron-containing alcohol dehydrogenase [Anaerolineae bacterium]NIN98935.1 iron-containing alcohol dehydrogenase [Anaerolineae bacterium]
MVVGESDVRLEKPRGCAVFESEWSRVKRLTGSDDARADEGVAWVQELYDGLEVPPLASYGLTSDDLPTLIEKASVGGSMRGNPVELTREKMEGILTRAL